MNGDGTVTVADAVILNKWLNNNSSVVLSTQAKLAADCYDPKGGEDITAKDSDAIVQNIVGNISLPYFA